MESLQQLGRDVRLRSYMATVVFGLDVLVST
jgi:hypothetical protein